MVAFTCSSRSRSCAAVAYPPGPRRMSAVSVAAHGAAVGQMDEAALFYLKSRGIGEAVARGLLVHGFVNEVIEASGSASSIRKS